MRPRIAILLTVLAVVTSELHAQASVLPAPPGKLVDVGGRRLHLLCTGSGSPTVLLEAGASSFAIDWTLVQPRIAESNRVCSYDRAGMGWSDPVVDSVRRDDAEDLHALLAAAGERPPYVLAGASRGGLIVRDFARQYPDEVIGLVLVDPASEDRLWGMVRGEAVLIAQMSNEQILANLPRQPVRVPRRQVQNGAPFNRLPAELFQTRMLLDQRLIASIPEMVTPEMIGASQERETALLARLLATRSAGQPLGARPVVVLSRGDERNAGREEVHAALAKLSSNSRHSVIAGAGHEIHLFEPDAVVLAIRDVLLAVRERAPLLKR